MDRIIICLVNGTNGARALWPWIAQLLQSWLNAHISAVSASDFQYVCSSLVWLRGLWRKQRKATVFWIATRQIREKKRFSPPCYCYHKEYVPYCCSIMILYWCFLIIFALMVTDLPLKSTFLFKVGIKWEEGEKSQAGPSSTRVPYSYSTGIVQVTPAWVAGLPAVCYLTCPGIFWDRNFGVGTALLNIGLFSYRIPLELSSCFFWVITWNLPCGKFAICHLCKRQP